MKAYSIGFQTGLVLLLASILLHVHLAPFTKVEESFNIQAVHDFLFHGPHVEAYDHQEFPGVVPRSFVGAATLATAAAPAVYPTLVLELPRLWAQLIVRGVLGFFSWLCIARLGVAVQRVFGMPTATCFALLSCAQFHIPFYASRTLPNVFAFGPVVLALSHWLDGTELWLVPTILTATTVIMRCDMLLLTGTVCLGLLVTRRMGFWKLLLLGLLSAGVALAATVALDSMVWGRWIWPEGEVFWFNTVLNKSKEWGVMPAHWYVTSALPRGLLASLPLSVAGTALEPRLRPFVASIMAFVALYSCLGHKELRFLFPVLPAFTVAAACGLERLWRNRSKSAINRVACLCSLGLVAASMAAVVTFTQASLVNYPGGEALRWLHEHSVTAYADQRLPAVQPVRVHMDTAACMTGVTRFGQVNPRWLYFKNETLTQEQLLEAQFDYLISATRQFEGYKLLQAVPAFDRFSLRSWGEIADMETPWPLELHVSPAIYVHQREQSAGLMAGQFGQ